MIPFASIATDREEIVKEESLRSYELMYILDPGLDEDSSKALVGRIEDLMTKQGVAIQSTEPWGRRRLAYRIKGHWEGNYILSQLKAAPQAISEMERRLRVTDGVLRFLTVRTDEEQAKLERRRAREADKEKARRERRGTRPPRPPEERDEYGGLSEDELIAGEELES
jgi:small subunit ribosomal protein S6